MRETLMSLLRTYEEAEGVSADYYCAVPKYHPMAEGKYLLTISALRRAELISTTAFNRLHRRAIDRLVQSTQWDSRGGCGFGLNFAYKESSPTDRFLITTSIVGHGLVESERLLSSPNVGARKLISGIHTWLSYLRSKDALALPNYSDEISRVVPNAIAYAALFEKLSSESGLSDSDPRPEVAAAWVRDQFVTGVGWPYTPDSRRVDLLHQCYIINSLTAFFGVQVEPEALTSLCGFLLPNTLLDKFDIASEGEVIDALSRSKSMCGRFAGNVSQVWSSQTARPWSVGESLIVAAQFSQFGQYAPAWRNVTSKILSIGQLYRERARGTKLDYDGQFRYSMHVAHGLASVLESRRSERSGRLLVATQRSSCHSRGH